MDDNRLQCLNTLGILTWFGSQEDTHPSVLDLTLINEVVIYGGQISELTISCSESLGSDHATLLLDFYPNVGTTMPPPPTPKGYRADLNNCNAWIKAFTLQYITSDNGVLDAGALTGTQAEVETASAYYLTSRAEANAYGVPDPVTSNPLIAAQLTLPTLLAMFNANLNKACCLTLEHKRNLDPQGLAWWNDECNLTHTAVCLATTYTTWMQANRDLHRALHQVKRDWAHERPHHAIADRNIWSLAKTHNG